LLHPSIKLGALGERVKERRLIGQKVRHLCIDAVDRKRAVEAEAFGGGIRAAGAAVSGGRLSGNAAAQDGGGAHLDGNAVMRRVRVSGNTAGNRGGGLAGDGATTRLENLLVTGNQAATGAGAT
jgi:predicted outer membrane repeat protein